MGFDAAELGWHLWHVYESLLWASVLLLALLAPLRLGVLLTNRLMGTVGLLSYSIYLFHLPIEFDVLHWCRGADPEAFQGWTPTSFATVMLSFALVLVVSTLTYLLIERPVLARKAKIAD
jgi:peptidoglycan/LPS O-acetylase OafA/YrhL